MSNPAHENEPQAPTCPRHPGVVSYVRCTRCHRPACPQCQRNAAVGIHCVDCVRDAAREAPQARTALGAPASRWAGSPVTVSLIALCVVTYVLQLVVPAVTYLLCFSPVVGAREPWRFLTAAFVHAPDNLMHIVFNMIALWALGQGLEHALGRWRYLALYLGSALGGSVVYLLMASTAATTLGEPTAWWQPSWGGITVGASGAVFGLFGAALVLARRLRLDVRSMVVVLAINAAIGFMPSANIAWQAHLGGFLTGAAMAAAVGWSADRRRPGLTWPAFAAVVAVLVALAVVKYAFFATPVVGWGV